MYTPSEPHDPALLDMTWMSSSPSELIGVIASGTPFRSAIIRKVLIRYASLALDCCTGVILLSFKVSRHELTNHVSALVSVLTVRAISRPSERLSGLALLI